MDGDTSTRWAVEGPDHWLQFALDPGRSLQRLDIQWYEGASRTYDFDMLVSDDGVNWHEVPCQTETASPNVLVSDRIDVCRAASGPMQAHALSYAVELANTSALHLTLTPVRGQARICGVVLTPTVSPVETSDPGSTGRANP
jgi:hypothetical protein